MKIFLRKIAKLAPWLVAGGILYWLFRLYPIDQILRALGYVNIWTLAAFVIAYFGAIWVIDAFGVAAVLRRFVGPISGQPLLTVRAAAYPPSLINYGAGQATFAYYLQRLYRMPVGDIVGVFTLITAVDLFWIAGLALGGSFIGEHRILGVNIAPTVQLVGGIIMAITAAHLAFWLFHWENRVRGRWWQRVFGWLRRKQLFRIFHEATFVDYVKLACWRFPIACCIVFSIYILVHCFDGYIPLSVVIGNVPIAVLIGVIPISWGGVGTSNKALVDLLAPHLQGAVITEGAVTAAELILALSLLWMLANYLCKLLVGLCCLPSVQRRIEKNRLVDQ